jgi:hypothetical protein
MATNINACDQTITQYNIQTGGANNLLNNVAPSATSGVAVISQGSSSQPVFGTVVVAGGGTGATTPSGARTNLGAAASGANSDITSLTGLTGAIQTPTSISVGGASVPVVTLTSNAGGGILQLSVTGGISAYVGTANNIPLQLYTGNVERGFIGTSGGIVWGTTSNTDEGTGTINVSGGYYINNNPINAFVWNNLGTATSQTMATNNGYFSNNSTLITYTLPATAAAGTTFRVAGLGAGGWSIVYNSGQNIQFGNVSTTTTTGNLSSANQYDCVHLLTTVANTTFEVISVQGNPTYV